MILRSEKPREVGATSRLVKVQVIFLKMFLPLVSLEVLEVLLSSHEERREKHK